MTLQQTPGVAAMARGAATSGTQLPTGYVALDDREAFERAVADDLDIVALLGAVRRQHTMEWTSQMELVFERAEGTAEMLRNELRQCFQWLTGGERL